MTDATLPAPTGRFAVGRTRFDLIDTSRNDTSAPAGANVKRELVLWVWYPAQTVPGSTPAPYLPAGWEACDQIMGMPLGTAALSGHAVDDAPMDTTGPFPVLLFSPAGFSALSYAATLDELASHGYVVVSICHTYESPVTLFADGRVVPVNPQHLAGIVVQQGRHEDAFAFRAGVAMLKRDDMAFVASSLSSLPISGAVNTERLGAFGHSLGGNAALEFCRTDQRCRTAVNLDGANWSEVGRVGVAKPALVITAEHPEMEAPPEALVAAGAFPSVEWALAERALLKDGWQVIADTGRPGEVVDIAGARHANFADLNFVPRAADSPLNNVLGSGDPVAIWRQTCDHLLRFFGKHLLTT